MKRFIIIIFLIPLYFSNLLAQSEIKKGIVFGGGIGSINSELKLLKNIASYDVSYKFNGFIGYKIRIIPKTNPFYFDGDLNIGLFSWNASYYDFNNQVGSPPTKEISTQYYHLSLNGLINYKLYKGLGIGLGVSPTYYFYEDGDKGKNKFDIPILSKIAYDFDKFEVGVTYRHGLVNVMGTDYLKTGKTREFLISVFIPF